jgi:sterol desaturase/sphingolipid hydroxylase (fatty acid hydroxylase superfamily)
MTMPLEAILGPMIPATYLVLLTVESLLPGRKFPTPGGWRFLGLGFTALIVAINATTDLWLPAGWLAGHRLLNLTGLGLWGVVPGLLVLTFVNYWFHRMEHRFDLTWRAMHQLHHSVQRVDVSGSAYTHPLEMVVQAAYGLIIFVFVLGLSPAAGALAGYLAAVLAMTQHLNVRTPRWIGFVVQRPESHCLHHEYGVHARNFGDLPIWDMLFGTFENPAAFEGRVGFDRTSHSALLPALIGRDVGSVRAEV